MQARSRFMWSCGVVIGLGWAAGGCSLVGEFVSPDLLSGVGGSSRVTILPDEAPGLLVTVENRTTRAVLVVVSYRSGEENVETYTTALSAGDKSGQMLVCPVTEITLGSVSDLSQPGVRVALVEDAAGYAIDQLPYLDVEPFGILLREEINYNCGDSILFVVRASGTARSGYETIAFFRRSTTARP